jgi:hypothetical protein
MPSSRGDARAAKRANCKNYNHNYNYNFLQLKATPQPTTRGTGLRLVIAF